MKRKRIATIILCIIITAVFLVGCGKNIISYEEIENMDNIAKDVKELSDYKLPDNYKLSYPDSTTNSRIKIKKKNVYITYDISQEEVKRIEVCLDTFDDQVLTVLFTVLITFVVIILLAVLTE